MSNTDKKKLSVQTKKDLQACASLMVRLINSKMSSGAAAAILRAIVKTCERALRELDQ